MLTYSGYTSISNVIFTSYVSYTGHMSLIGLSYMYDVYDYNLDIHIIYKYVIYVLNLGNKFWSLVDSYSQAAVKMKYQYCKELIFLLQIKNADDYILQGL